MFDYTRGCRAYFDEVARVAKAADLSQTEQLFAMVAQRSVDATLFVAGNGGGATVAEHLALGMSLNAWRETGTGHRVVCLSSSGAMLSAAVNDFGIEGMFAAQLRAQGRKGDVLVVVSASGASKNLVNVLSVAHDLSMKTAAIVGHAGLVSERSDYALVLNTPHAAVAEDVTIMILHWLYGMFMVKA